MCVYRFDSVAVAIGPENLAAATGLHRLCASLGSRPMTGAPPKGMREATLRLHARGADLPSGAMVRYDTPGFRIFGDTEGSYVSDGASVLFVQGDGSSADAYLDDSFHRKPPFLQWQFWSFCILTLLRPLGYFSLHTAALASPDGAGLLIAGPSGSGKTTLAVGLIRAGWGYLSDDAALLFRRGPAVLARPLRTQFYVDGAAASSYVDLRLGREAVDAAGGGRRQLHVDDHFASQRIGECRPTLLVFPTIVKTERSSAVRLDTVSSVQRLLAASAPQLFDRCHMPEHLAMLGCLVRQAAAFHLEAGHDLYREPAGLVDLIASATQP
jgi:hypothetical protein